MRIEDLRVFTALAETGNLHRAAQKSGMTQSAVTKLVQRLEAEFDIQLINRGGRGVELTPAGQVLLERAAAVRDSVAQTYAEMAVARSASSGRIRVGTVPTLLETVFAPLMARYADHETDVSFSLTLQVSSLLIEEVIEGKIDLAFCYPQEAVPPELHSDDLGRQRYHFAGRRGHPLCSALQALPALAEARWLLPPPGHGMRRFAEQFYRDQALGTPRIAIETVVSTSLLTTLIRESDLVTIMTEQVLQGPAGKDLVALPYEGATFESGLRLFYRRNASLSPVVRRFRDALVQALASGSITPWRG
ncbi:LysR family transcriptional regulator [Comamonas sp. GB3 AK4-5]|uniref:LysR family transcriptional regulator n=1 Tax=Comamonas sp. GB3 AK4-5 TaxID=3231487 RepID=UPI00351ED6FD